MKNNELKKHNNLKWTLKDELEMLTTDELLEIQKLIVSFYDKEVKDDNNELGLPPTDDPTPIREEE